MNPTSSDRLKPKEVAFKAWQDSLPADAVFSYLADATPRELIEFINYFSPHQNSQWFHKAKVFLDVRLAEDAAKTADKLIQHTEQLTRQTDTHIQHAEKLTHQTEKLLNESVSLTALTKQLRFWTIMLGVFAVVQIFIMVFDYIRHK